ncbi:hypothetical protein MRM75_06655 [bacterium 19CA06SA08-2]|uniref:Uncharacterized protein n=1 Tax=bacterium 19CA06SA08-2 TaxID=2920658 RepID=A0AAU6UC33_UNCXX
MSAHLKRVLDGISLPYHKTLALSGRQGVISFLRCERDQLLYVFNLSLFRFSSLSRRQLGMHSYRLCDLTVCFAAISETHLLGAGYRQHLNSTLRATPWGYELQFVGGDRPEWGARLQR